MRQFKFRDFIFGRILPNWYKENDSYKNSEGYGIVERFVNICEDYFDNDVNPDIDNIMNIIDADTTHEIFINYMWEYFGFIPYAYGVLLKTKPYTKEDIEKWINEPPHYPRADFRNALKYAISLYKIRCTLDFYTILGRFYELKIEVIEPPSTLPPTGGGVEIRYDQSSYYDTLTSRYDHTYDCLQCIDISAKVGIPNHILSHLDFTEINSTYLEVTDGILNILNKYLPINVNKFTRENVDFYEL